MPKKRNFLGGMQNYNPENGQYESRLTKANGTPATKENMPGGEDKKESSALIEQIEKNTLYKELSKKNKDGTISEDEKKTLTEYETEIDVLNNISKSENELERAKYFVDKANERMKSKEFKAIKQKIANGEATQNEIDSYWATIYSKQIAETIIENLGEDNKKSFKSFSKKQDYQSVLRKWGYDPDDKLTEQQIDDVIAQLEKEQDMSDTIEGQNGKLYDRKSGVEMKEGMNDEIINAFKEKKKSLGKKETKKPTDYAGVEETPYGFIYNVGNTSITDLKAQRKSMGMGVDENKEYGYTVFKDGDEVYYSTFEEAYKSAKGKDTSFDDINSKRMGNTKFEKKTDLQTNEDIDWDLTEKNEKINGKNAKSKTRKDKYGNPLVSDEAFMIGYEAGKAYLEDSLKYNTLDSLKRSNVFLGYLSQYISNAIINNGYNPDLDMTYADENEIIGAIVGEEVDMESYEINKTKGWTGRKYNGYKPKDTTFEEINAKRMGTNQ